MGIIVLGGLLTLFREGKQVLGSGSSNKGYTQDQPDYRPWTQQ